MLDFNSQYLETYSQLKLAGEIQRDTFTLGYKSFSVDSFPLLTLRKMNYSSLLTDLFWQLTGSSNIAGLGKYKCIWKPWANEAGYLQSSYGRYLRNFPALDTYGKKPNEKWPIEDPNIWQQHRDQLSNAALILATNPDTRRSYYPLTTPQMLTASVQPNCVSDFSVNCINGKVELTVNSRSTDFCLGLPYNMAHFWIIGQLITFAANEFLLEESGSLGSIPPNLHFHKLNFSTSNLHIYGNHLNILENCKPPLQERVAPVFNWVSTEFSNKDHKLFSLKTGEKAHIKFSQRMQDYQENIIIDFPKTLYGPIKLPMKVNDIKPGDNLS